MVQCQSCLSATCVRPLAVGQSTLICTIQDIAQWFSRSICTSRAIASWMCEVAQKLAIMWIFLVIGK